MYNFKLGSFAIKKYINMKLDRATLAKANTDLNDYFFSVQSWLSNCGIDFFPIPVSVSVIILFICSFLAINKIERNNQSLGPHFGLLKYDVDFSFVQSRSILFLSSIADAYTHERPINKSRLWLAHAQAISRQQTRQSNTQCYNTFSFNSAQ